MAETHFNHLWNRTWIKLSKAIYLFSELITERDYETGLPPFWWETVYIVPLGNIFRAIFS